MGKEYERMKFYNYLNEDILPQQIIDELLKDRPKSIEKKLSKLPIIPKGKYIGNMKAQDCETNTKKYVKNNPKADKYEGYLIWYDEEWNMVLHTFPVENGKVIECTNLDDGWDKNTYYIGKKVK